MLIVPVILFALDGLNAASKAKINATDAQCSVHWLMSYANGQQDQNLLRVRRAERSGRAQRR
jgi:hypothetical protein